MKRFLCSLLVGTMCLGLLSGCGQKETKEASNGETDAAAGQSSVDLSNIYSGELEQNITIRVLENDTAIAEGYFQELIDAFNEEYAEYGIVAVDANMDQYSNLADDGPYGYGPDVLY